ncbi:hypothetical protein [Leptolyngbya phage Lbo-JY46]
MLLQVLVRFQDSFLNLQSMNIEKVLLIGAKIFNFFMFLCCFWTIAIVICSLGTYLWEQGFIKNNEYFKWYKDLYEFSLIWISYTICDSFLKK